MFVDTVVSTSIIDISIGGVVGVELVYGWLHNPYRELLIDLDIEFYFRGLLGYRFPSGGNPLSWVEYVIRFKESDLPMVKLTMNKTRPFNTNHEERDLLVMVMCDSPNLSVDIPPGWESNLSNPPVGVTDGAGEYVRLLYDRTPHG